MSKSVVEPKRKRVVVSIDKKVAAIKRVDHGEKMNVVAASYGVSRNTVSDWHRNKAKLFKFLTESATNAAGRKSMKITPTPKINEAVYLWCYSIRSKGYCLRQDQSSKKRLKFYLKNFPMKTTISRLVKVDCIDRKLFMKFVN